MRSRPQEALQGDRWATRSLWPDWMGAWAGDGRGSMGSQGLEREAGVPQEAQRFPPPRQGAAEQGCGRPASKHSFQNWGHQQPRFQLKHKFEKVPLNQRLWFWEPPGEKALTPLYCLTHGYCSPREERGLEGGRDRWSEDPRPRGGWQGSWGCGPGLRGGRRAQWFLGRALGKRL